VVDGFGEVVARAEPARATVVILDRHDDHGDRRGHLPSHGENGLAAAIGQVEIQDHGDRRLRAERCDRCGHGPDDLAPEAMTAGEGNDEIGIAALSSTMSTRAPAITAPDTSGSRTAKVVPSSTTLGERDAPTVQLDELLRERETEAAARGVRPLLVRALEDGRWCAYYSPTRSNRTVRFA
jgi:hypothetical protein